VLKKDKLNMLNVFIKKAIKGHDCDWDLLEHMCFENAEWYIDGGNYCQAHAQDVIRILNDNGAGIDPKKINWLDKLEGKR
jgi:hypothetical protein